MTMFAERHHDQITIGGNSGGRGVRIEQDFSPGNGSFVTVKITDHVDHVRGIWSHLGQLIAEWDEWKATTEAATAEKKGALK